MNNITLVGKPSSISMIKLEAELQRVRLDYKVEDSGGFYSRTHEPVLYSPAIFIDGRYIGYNLTNIKTWMRHNL